MIYPSILFYENQNGTKIPEEVFEDLKLTSLIGTECIDTLALPCSAVNIAARQEVFKELEDKAIYNRILQLFEAAKDVFEKSAIFDTSACDSESYAVFVSLMNSVCSFMLEASSCVFSSNLLNRFSSFFKNEVEKEEFCNITDAISEVYPILNKLSGMSFIITGEELSLAAASKESYSQQLRKNALELGLEPKEKHRSFCKRLSKNVIEGMASIYQNEFEQFKLFYNKFSSFYKKEIISYKKELELYICLCRLCESISEYDMPLVYPKISEKRVYFCKDACDYSLILRKSKFIVPNDIDFNESSHFFYLTGANGGGKTTYLRTVGLNLILFLNGCPIAAQEAVIYPFKCIFTHFPRDERFENTGRFIDEKKRIDNILSNADDNSMILLNETFSTTSEAVAVEQTELLAQRLNSEKKFGIYITHQHTISDIGIPILSVIVDEIDNNRRTYKISKNKSASSSFAEDILRKYSLTKKSLEERFGVILK